MSSTNRLPVILFFTAAIAAQVPRTVRINSTFHPANGSAISFNESATLAIYTSETGGNPLWQETQNVTLDNDGHYSVLLGATASEGLPAALFATSEPRWLGVRFHRPGETEQARILLASVPYAIKASDADTLGGRPASDYLRNPAAAASAAPTIANALETRPRFATAGTTNSLALFTDPAGDIGNSVLYQNNGKIGLGTTSPLDYFHVAFTDTSGGFTGFAVQNRAAGANSYSGMLFYDQNGALAQFQGFNNSTHEYRINNVAQTNGFYDGSINFMIGSDSVFKVSAASTNTAVGAFALSGNNLGSNNTAMGRNALDFNSSGSNNTAVGSAALLNAVGSSNNTALGYYTLGLTSGSNNIAIGVTAGYYVTDGHDNILIGYDAHGLSSLSNTIVIGDPANQNRAFIAGVRGVNTGNNNAVPVYIDSSNQLGTASSSRRYKEDIQDMAEASSKLMQLRPVTFRYKKPYADGSKPVDYGLIAEEVDKVYPDMVVRNDAGQVETVQYQKLTPMLLNELQKQHRTIQELEEQNKSLEARIAALEASLSSKAPTAGQ